MTTNLLFLHLLQCLIAQSAGTPGSQALMFDQAANSQYLTLVSVGGL